MSYKGFTEVELNRPKQSYFDMTHRKRSSTRMGRLTPIFCKEAIPGDVWNNSSDILTRLAPLLAPIYDQIICFVHFFFVPNRLLWEEWEEFITGGRLGAEAAPDEAPIPPYFDLQDYMDAGYDNSSSLGDYLGLPIFNELGYTAVEYAGVKIDVMAFAAYQKAYMDYYRDRNFVADDLLTFPLPSGEIAFPNGYADLRTRSYLHDYFTSALPFTQRGGEVLIPVDASVTYLRQSIVKRSDTGATLTNFDLLLGTQTTPTYPPGSLGFSNDGGATEQTAGRIENIDSISNTTTTIGDFRSAYALQVWLERNAIGGSRYTESTQAHFGVKPQDERLQRAEYLGGGRIDVQIQEVVAPNWSNDGTADVPAGNLGGKAIAYGNTNQFRYFCPEHGFIIGILSYMNPPSYHQGVPRMFRRKTFLDYPWPTFATLGEQQIDKAELWGSPENLTEDTDGQLPLFGYTSRYADWKWEPSTNHGDFHDTLLFWTLTREFTDSPVLSEEFNLFDDSTQDRIFAVGGAQDNFWLYIQNKCGVKRALPYFGKPNTLGFGS